MELKALGRCASRATPNPLLSKASFHFHNPGKNQIHFLKKTDQNICPCFIIYSDVFKYF